MSESAELVERLRAIAKIWHGWQDRRGTASVVMAEAADAIEKLEGERNAAIRDQCVPTCHEIADKAIDRATAAEARVKVLEEALRPFAVIAECVKHSTGMVYANMTDCERARAALTPAPSPHQPPAPPPHDAAGDS